MALLTAITIGGLLLTGVSRYSQGKQDKKDAKKQKDLGKKGSEITQDEIDLQERMMSGQLDSLYDTKLAYRDQQEHILGQIDSIYGAGELQQERLDNQADSVLHKQQALNFNRAEIALQKHGNAQQRGFLNQRAGLYGSMMQHATDTANAIRSETLQRVNVDLSRMELNKQHAEDQQTRKMAVREIQTLRDRSNIMVATGEAGVGGSSVGRMISQAISDGEMEKTDIQAKTTAFLQDLSIQASGSIMDAKNQVANAERQALSQKLQALVSINQIASQKASLRLQSAGMDIKMDRIDHQEEAFNIQLDDLQIRKEQVALDTEMSVEDQQHRAQQIDHQITKIEHQKDQLAMKIEGLDYVRLRDELGLESRNIGLDRAIASNPLLNSVAEIAPTAIAMWMNYGS